MISTMPAGKTEKGKRSEEEEAPDGNSLVHPEALVSEALTAISLLDPHQFGSKSTAWILEMTSEMRMFVTLLKKSQSMFKCHPTAGDEDQTAEEEEQQGAPFFFTIIATAKTPK